MKILVLIGRLLYSLIFLDALAGHFSSASIQYAASAGVPMANILVPFAGMLAFAGGLSILLGFRARAGAWCIVAFLLPVTFTMHQYWNITDVMQMHVQKAMFMKNVSMMGAALMIAYFGSGPLSVDNNRKKQKPVQVPEPNKEVVSTPHI